MTPAPMIPAPMRAASDTMGDRDVLTAQVGQGASLARRVAAIDCGTNSLRLLIADVSAVRGELSDVQRRMEIVRLGQGVDATGRLSPLALARTFGVLREYSESI